MSNLSSFVDCVQVQTDLMTAWNYNNLGHDGAAGIKFALSPINKNGFIQDKINAKPGGLREVQVIFPQRILESQIDDGGAINCVGGEKVGETYETYTLDRTAGGRVSWTIDPDDLVLRCQSNPLYVAETIKMYMDGLIEKIDTDYLAYLAANLGNFASDVDNGYAAGTNTFVTTRTKNSNGILVEDAYQDVTFHFKNNRFNSVPYGFGTELWYNYARSKNAASVGETGVDVKSYATQYPFGFGYSHKMAQVLGVGTDAIFVAPGVSQMIWFNEFTGPNGSISYFNNGGTITQGIINYPDATIPLSFDYRAEYKCVGETRYWELQLAIAYDFISLPTTMFQVGDRLYGVNGINKFRITNP